MVTHRTVKRGDGFITERVRKDGTIGYQARWHDGARWRAKTFSTLDDAEDHLRTIGRKRRAGHSVAVSDLTVRELVEGYIDRGRRRWSTNTVATYSLLLRQQIVPSLGSVRIVDLTPVRVQRWIDALAGEVSAAVVENARTVLSGACREAVRLGLIPANPVADTRAPARPRAAKVTWTADEIERVLDTVANNVRQHAFYLVALTTAIRPGELRALQWGDIDFDAGVMQVRRTMTRTEEYRHIVGETTKTSRTRAIALPAETVTALRRLRIDQRERRLAATAWNDRDLVFDRGDGNPLAQQSVATMHRRICEAAEVRRIRLHDLRHTAATQMLRANVHPKVVADVLGHSSVTTTLDIYSHVDVSMQRSAIETLADTIVRRRSRA